MKQILHHFYFFSAFFVSFCRNFTQVGDYSTGSFVGHLEKMKKPSNMKISTLIHQISIIILLTALLSESIPYPSVSPTRRRTNKKFIPKNIQSASRLRKYYSVKPAVKTQKQRTILFVHPKPIVQDRRINRPHDTNISIHRNQNSLQVFVPNLPGLNLTVKGGGNYLNFFEAY